MHIGEHIVAGGTRAVRSLGGLAPSGHYKYLLE